MASVTDFKQALDSQQARGITKIDPVTIPGFGPSSQSDAFDPNKYKVHYSKIDFDDPSSISVLEILETRALRNEGVYILTKEKFNFMDKCFLIVSYLEKEVSPVTKK